MRGKLVAFALVWLMLMSGYALLPARLSAAGNLNELSSGSDFVARYCVHLSHTGDPPYSSDAYLFVYSNGTATYQFNSTSGWGSTSTNWTTQLSSALISNLHDVMISEGFMSFNDTYYDPGSSDAWEDRMERACIEISGELKTVTFYGRSMIGIAPSSFAILNNIIPVVVGGSPNIPDATLDISVTESPGGNPFSNISANFTNNGDTILTDSGLCNTSWPLFIVSVNGTYVDDCQKDAVPYCYMEFDSQTTTEFGPWEWNRTGLASGSYVIMSRVCIWDYVVGNITSNSSWIPVDTDPEPDDGVNLLYVGLGGLGAVLAIGVAAFYVFLVRRTRT